MLTDSGKQEAIKRHETMVNFLYDLLDEDKISKEVAEAIYTGIIHDTGVLKYQATTKRTMEIASSFLC